MKIFSDKGNNIEIRDDIYDIFYDESDDLSPKKISGSNIKIWNLIDDAVSTFHRHAPPSPIGPGESDITDGFVLRDFASKANGLSFSFAFPGFGRPERGKFHFSIFSRDKSLIEKTERFLYDYYIDNTILIFSEDLRFVISYVSYYEICQCMIDTSFIKIDENLYSGNIYK